MRFQMRRPSNDAVATWTPVGHILCLHLLLIIMILIVLNHDLYGLKHHIVEMRGGVTDAGRTNEQTLKIELLSQWMIEAEFRNIESP